jgi:NAD(P)-dependent dehydrogenase (short-subunit alcohol dehydrogenase family)
MATPYTINDDGFEIQFGTNHIGHHYLAKLLLPKLKVAAPSRIVNVSSRAHMMASPLTPETLDVAFRPTKAQYGAWSAYGNSKLANILEARSLNTKYASDGVTAYSLHPGVVATELGRQGLLTKFFYSVGSFAMKTPEEGAGTSIYCATSEAALVDAGKFFDVCAPSAQTSQMGLDDNLAEALWIKTEAEIAAWKAKSQGEAANIAASEAVPAAEEQKE